VSMSVHVEWLVLEGIEVVPTGRTALCAAVERELGGLLARRGLGLELGAGGFFPSIRGGVAHLVPNAQPAVIGGQIAAAIYGGLRT
jgi:hypothetical protein